MKLSFDRVSRPTGLVGVLLLCGLTVVGCSKKEESADKSDETKVEVVTTNPVVKCDDQMALTQLTQSVKSTLGAQSQNLFKNYADNVGESLSVTNVNNAAGSILVDIANPKVIQDANAQGMVTCSASLSLTLPNQDISRADRVYSQIEERSLADLLRSENIVLNNNMLVSDNFNYVVGMQGGQSVARVVGQPAILMAAADVIAKSQFQAVIDSRRSAPDTNKPRPAPALPAEPRQPSQPRVRPEPEQKQKPAVRQTQPARSAEAQTQAQQKPAVKPAEPAKPTASEAPKTSASKPAPEQNSNLEAVAKPKPKPLTVPKDDDMEMVIIEEEGTY